MTPYPHFKNFFEKIKWTMTKVIEKNIKFNKTGRYRICPYEYVQLCTLHLIRSALHLPLIFLKT